MSQTIRILIFDDHPVVRGGLQWMLAEVSDFQVVGEAEDGRESWGSPGDFTRTSC